MLEFQEGFFEQEIRNGFYIDVTMKTVWAAELEVLQRVAEVCDRHGITWYAAYGTLLGAIRHEGFIPWDDDMDIWVKRKDYNKLLQILPRELPEGYLVRGPLTEAGYDQFHTCINNGSVISTNKEWLEQYHGCPFSVGLDIFPLDYLPRDENEQELQEKLFSVAMSCAQSAMAMEEDEGEDSAERRQAFKEKIGEGIRYLEESCGIRINCQPVEEEKWEKAASELWRWANYFAMMYGEEESDCLVEYVDYIQQPEKKFSKEWFKEVYSANFENFMLPIPCGYDQVLRSVYGNYEYMVKKTGQHEYPYYARQLRELREKVHERQQQAQLVGLLSSEAVLLLDSDISLPAEWEVIVKRGDGRSRKLILYANDLDVFFTYREKALDRLEKVLSTFEAAQNQMVLWWRPQRTMEETLESVSWELAERYRRILEHYKKAGWGICDESDNIDRAVELCNAYYGEMNAILQPFQNIGKPIMISNLRKNDRRVGSMDCKKVKILSEALVKVDNRLICAAMDMNLVYSISIDDGELRLLDRIPEEPIMASRLCGSVAVWKSKIIFSPYNARKVWLYDMGDDAWTSFELVHNNKNNIEGKFYKSVVFKNYIYMIPCRYPNIVKINLEDGSVTELDIPVVPPVEFPETEYGYFFSNCVLENNILFLASCVANFVLKMDLENGTYDWTPVGRRGNKYVGIAKANNYFWLAPRRNTSIVRWDGIDGIKEFALDSRYNDMYHFWGIVPWKGVFLPGIFPDKSLIVSEDDTINKVADECGYTFADILEEKYFIGILKSGKMLIEYGTVQKEYSLFVEKEAIHGLCHRKISNINDIFGGDIIEENEYFGLEDYLKALE